ncbi:MAG: M3 family oligoendopeptidase [Coprobacillus sp.]|nr:M3 family oligoendopeptidase [Coprobacillus sp.]
MKDTPLKFEEFKVHSLAVDHVEPKMVALVNELKKCGSITTARLVIKKWNKLMDEVGNDVSLAEVLYTLDTTDKTNIKRQEQSDELVPVIEKYAKEFHTVLLKAPYRKELTNEVGEYCIKMWEQSMRVMDDFIIPDMVEENKLVSEYTAILASSQIEFRGEVLTVSQLGKYTISPDRDTRREASLLQAQFLGDNEEKIGEIYDKLVHLRTEMAHKLGYKSYTEMAYDRLGRTDYGPKEVKGYRDQIYDSVVPLAQKLFRTQIKGLGIKNPQFYDYTIEFESGNPRPIGNSETQVATACGMYDDLDPEIGTFFHFMVDHHLLDLDARAKKGPGGYCTYFPKYGTPFVFANNNGTQQDVETLTHEIGHAFQFYTSKKIKVPEYRNPTLETCEIHSMSMEFLTWPYMDRFFGDDADKFKYTHLKGAITFLPYGVLIDEFQHWVYANPDATHEERCKEFKKLQEKYQPHLKFEESEVLNHGGWWMRQHHIFQAPFYYIDYTLAQVVAFQFLADSQKNPQKTIKKYIKLCKYGGRSPFTETLAKNHLRNPFEEGNVEKSTRPLKKILNGFDTTKF